MHLFRTRYRVVKDKSLGFEVEFRFWWMCWYEPVGGFNSHPTPDQALEFIERVKVASFITKLTG